jgi:hypothetical protein
MNKREELKEKIEQKFGEACGRYVVLVDMDAVMRLIDEYTKPKTKKKSLEERQTNFRLKIMDMQGDDFPLTLCVDFYDYWTEHNEGGAKMRFEMSKNQPFNIKRRLATWKRNQKNYNNGNKPTATQNRNATEDDINNYINS